MYAQLSHQKHWTLPGSGLIINCRAAPNAIYVHVRVVLISENFDLKFCLNRFSRDREIKRTKLYK
jgi:hypothetical protein